MKCTAGRFVDAPAADLAGTQMFKMMMICYDLSVKIISIIIICVPFYLSASGGFFWNADVILLKTIEFFKGATIIALFLCPCSSFKNQILPALHFHKCSGFQYIFCIIKYIVVAIIDKLVFNNKTACLIT